MNHSKEKKKNYSKITKEEDDIETPLSRSVFF